jgi:RHS repeat-associated protein
VTFPAEATSWDWIQLSKEESISWGNGPEDFVTCGRFDLEFNKPSFAPIGTVAWLTCFPRFPAPYAYADGPTEINTLGPRAEAGLTTSFAYDADGNFYTKTGGWDFDWNSENLMTSASENGARKQAYAYDGLGRRVKVEGSDPNKWTVSIVSGQEVLFEANLERDGAGTVTTKSTTKYVYGAGMRVARIDCTPSPFDPSLPPVCTTYYYHGDHLGSTQKMTKHARGTPIVFSAGYDPFGKPYAVSGTLAESFKFTGEKHDGPTGLVYLRARQYDPEIGRFVSLDPVLGSLSAPQSLNRYAYVVNNPLRYTDPTGEIAPLIALAIVLLVVGTAGVGVGVASHYVPEIRPFTDPFADLVSFVPLYGDAFALGYYGAQGGLDCAAGSCDPVMLGINLGGSIPIVGDLGKAVKYGGMGIGFLGLVTKGGRHADALAGFGFKSFDAWKAAFGKHPWRWHHIVEQTPSNVARFGPEALHNINNMILVTKSFHKRITKFYQRIPADFDTGGKTFRAWLADKSFQEQLAWGWYVIRRLGG